MADAILSAAVGQILGLLEEQTRYHVNLVRGAEKEVHTLAKELKILRNVMDDAESRRFKDKNVDYWLSRLEQTSYQMEDVLDQWSYAILKLKIAENDDHLDDDVVDPPKQKVCSFIPSSSCLCFKKAAVRHDIAKKILSVKDQLDAILKEKDRYKFEVSQPATADDLLHKPFPIQSTSLIDLEKVHGRDRDRDSLVNKVLDDSAGITVLSIVGVGGLGKTTLAQLVYNDSRVEKSFDIRIWVCVSNPFDINAICKWILDSIGNVSCPNTDRLDALLKHVIQSLSGKRFLLVLDDVWTEDYKNWEPLEDSFKSCGGVGSKVLVTTRNEKVAKMMGSKEREICHPGLLSEEDCWSILCRMALSERNEKEYKEVGMKIVKKCNGLPLAVKTLGSLLRFKKNLQEWENVVNSEIWEMKEAEVDLFPHLLLTYNELSATHKRCFSYCAIFPKDSKIVVESLIGDWMALGYLGSDKCEMELKGRECFDVLAMRSLFQDFEKDDTDEVQSCKMHDIVHDFAQFLRKSGGVEASEMNKATCGACDASFVSKVNVFCSLDCNGDQYPLNSCDCLARLRVLTLTKKRFPQETFKLIHLRSLKLIFIDKLSSEDLKIIFQFYNLKNLVLRGCNVEEIPGEIKNLIYLRHLEISYNDYLMELPTEIGKLICLRHLEISYNKSLVELPAEIGKLICLRCLKLNYNRSLKRLPSEIKNLVHLKLFQSENSCLEELPKEIGNLINLRSLILTEDLYIDELPREIGNLVNLHKLDLSGSTGLKLPNEFCNLINLQDLNISSTFLVRLPNEIGNLVKLRRFQLKSIKFLKELPESICGLQELQELNIHGSLSLCRLSEGFGQLTSLRSLVGEFRGGSGGSKFGLLKKLNNLGGELQLKIQLEDDDDDLEGIVKDAREAELKKKTHLLRVYIKFADFCSNNSVRMDVLDALEPHPNLEFLNIWNYEGLKVPMGWIDSPLNQLKALHLESFHHLTSLPTLGRLPCLETVRFSYLSSLQFVGRELIGGGNTQLVAFPKLKELIFESCEKWKEWEDITEAEEQLVSIMPCLTTLRMTGCNALPVLPHHLLRKALLLEEIEIRHSAELAQSYRDKDGLHWKSISLNNPKLSLKII